MDDQYICSSDRTYIKKLKCYIKGTVSEQENDPDSDKRMVQQSSPKDTAILTRRQQYSERDNSDKPSAVHGNSKMQYTSGWGYLSGIAKPGTHSNTAWGVKLCERIGAELTD